MKKIFLLFACMYSITVTYSQTNTKGFREYNWDTPYAEMASKLTPSKNITPGFKGYDMKDADMNFEGVKAHTITYLFKNNLLYAVNVGIYNKDLETVVASLTQKYGEPKYTETPFLKNYEWHMTYTSVAVSYFFANPSDQSVTIGFSKKK